MDEKKKETAKRPNRLGLKKVAFKGTGIYTPPPDAPVNQEEGKANGERSEN